MSREVRRVPLDFDWPLDTTWEGYIRPDRLSAEPCADCDGRGWSKAWQALHDLWYGYAPFTPEQNGSTPFAWDHPVVLAFAQRNLAHAPGFYGTDDTALHREARRLVALWNGAWSHHLNAADVAALVASERLRDLTHTRVKAGEWVPKETMPTPEQVNEWSLTGWGHGSINAHVVISARLQRDGISDLCPTCKGSGERSDRKLGHLVSARQMEHDAWEPTPPPAGDGWQLWETVSEGSPVTPVFPTSEALAAHLVAEMDWSTAAAALMIRDGWAPSGVVTSRGVFQNGEALVEMEASAIDPVEVA